MSSREKNAVGEQTDSAQTSQTDDAMVKCNGDGNDVVIKYVICHINTLWSDVVYDAIVRWS